MHGASLLRGAERRRFLLVIKPPAHIPVKPGIDTGLTELIDLTETIYSITGVDPAYRRLGRDLTPRLRGETDSGREFVFCESGHSAGQPECHQLTMEEMIEQRDQWDAPGPYWPGNHTIPIEDPFPLNGKVTMVRDQRYKLVLRLYEQDAFYDLLEDPFELKNRIHDPELQPIVQRFRDAFARWLWETDSTVPFQRDKR